MAKKKGGFYFKYNPELLKNLGQLNPNKEAIYNCLSCSQKFAGLSSNLAKKASNLTIRPERKREGIIVLDGLNKFFKPDNFFN